MKTLDRYLIRECLPPFLLALGLFTFLLQVKPMLERAQDLLAKGVPIPTVGFLLVTLLPQALGVTIPMAFLAGLLMGLGRLSGDREIVALLACGASPVRLLRPILLFALICGAADMYVLVRLVPDANQRFLVETYKLMTQSIDVKPGLFYEGFPGKVLYVRSDRPDGGWSDVLLADTSQPGRPIVTTADRGYLELDPVHRLASIVLPGDSVRYLPGEEDGVYDTSHARDFRVQISAQELFGSPDIGRGLAEMSISELRKAEAKKRAAGISPHPEIMQRHQMFSFPVACPVFALLGLALGVHTRKDGKLGGFALGIGVLFAYYGFFALFQNLTKGGHFPAEWARWVPDIVLGLAGIAALYWRTRSVGGEITMAWPAWLRLPRRRGLAAAGTTDAPRTVLVIRLPEFNLPRPRLLDFYVGRRYVTVVLLAFVGLLGLYYIGTFIDKSERLFKGQADAWMLVQYFYYSTPQFIAYVVPMATLVAALATIGGLTRTGELVVMRACGVSLYRIAAPVLLLSLVWSGALFVLGDRVLARANHHADVLEDEIRGLPPHTTNTLENENWFADAGRIYYYRAYDTAARTIHGLSVFTIAESPYRLASHTFANRATYRGRAWRAERGWTQQFSASGVTRDAFATRPLVLVPPTQLAGVRNQATDLMTFGELRQHIARIAASGFSLADSRVTLQERVAFPLVAVVMTLLGVPFGVTTGRRGALYGVGLAIILGAAYWLVNSFFIAVGQAALMPAILAAWAANLLFLALAAYMTLTVRT
jgi:LPS export ABC transporter permease LptG/LPS export ABC transporter permease LptF